MAEKYTNRGNFRENNKEMRVREKTLCLRRKSDEGQMLGYKLKPGILCGIPTTLSRIVARIRQMFEEVRQAMIPNNFCLS